MLTIARIFSDTETITIHAREMSRSLRKSELTERRALIESLLWRLRVYATRQSSPMVPMTNDSLIAGQKGQEIPLNSSVAPSGD